MNNFNTIFQTLVRNIQRVLKQVLAKESKPRYNFFLDMCFGIFKSSSLILNDIAHSLNEKTTLSKVNYRLQRNLSIKLETNIHLSFIQATLKYMDDDSLTFIVDDSDIAKPYGKHFEGLSLVRDNSSLKKEFVKGYLVTSIIGLSKNYKHPICLYEKVHSSTTKNYKSANVVTNDGIRNITINLKPWTSTFVFDRGYDDEKIMNLVNNEKQYFLIRIRKNRNIIIKSRKSLIFVEANKRKGKINIDITYKGKPAIIKASHFEGKISSYKDKATIVSAYLDNSYEPLILISNKKIHSKKDLINLVLKYHSRWKIEEFFRFKKVQFGLENFRVKELETINNLFFILNLVILIIAHIIENKHKNTLHDSLINISKKLRDDIYIKYYQLESGIKTVFTSNKTGVKNYKKIEKWETVKPNLFNSLELKVRKSSKKSKKTIL